MDAGGPEKGTAFWRHWTSVPAPQRPPWFDEIIGLTFQEPASEDCLDGVVAARIQEYVGPGFRESMHRDFRYRVQRRGHLVRLTSLDGSIHMIAGRDTLWTRRDMDNEIVARPRSGPAYPPDDYEFGTARPDSDYWTGDDFTTPTGPASEVLFLGRPAWEVELAPPPRKPHPLQLTIDRETGLLLRNANAAFGTFHEWTELTTRAVLDDELFTWKPHDVAAHRYE